MPEFRQDPTSGQWAIIAAERASRPGLSVRPEARDGRERSETECPFCPGNESQTPPEILRRPDAVDWVVRVVPNKFPALVPGRVPLTSAENDLYSRVQAHGRYEVIIEGSEHRVGLAPADPSVLRETFLAAQERCRAFLRDPELRYVSLFKNHGTGAGASLPHPHWQLAVGPIVPHSLQRMLDVSASYWGYHGRSVYEDIVERELDERRRLVLLSERFVALTPFAPQWAGETWIVPREDGAQFGELARPALEEFADVLRGTLARVARAFDNPSANVLVVSAPLRVASTPGFRWHVRIQPRLTTPGGFELASGIAITTWEPESVAALLRAADAGG